MKRIFLLAFIALLAFAMVSCDTVSNTSSSGSKSGATGTSLRRPVNRPGLLFASAASSKSRGLSNSGSSARQDGKTEKCQAGALRRRICTKISGGATLNSHIMKEDHGFETDGQQYMIWAHGMMLLGMELCTRSRRYKDPRPYSRPLRFTQDCFTEEMLVRPGKWPNIAVDDAGWDAMAYMIFYRVTGDPYALKVAGKVIRNSYEHWKDGSVKNGLWYNNDRKFKSLYSAGLVTAALDYCEASGDQSLYNDTMAIYQWMRIISCATVGRNMTILLWTVMIAALPTLTLIGRSAMKKRTTEVCTL